ncbi:reverse transcriptase domain-containing protein [Bacteroides sp. AM16-13]|mgnify:FL=1|uniref:reverse transcriptase domain-containing protein n=1 Tax=Bacteroides sp. AM16-13 TaxID=2292938 RepID=UPI000E7629C0|nr:reverse transcriptase domain-containing protein [Bacteroides sp. AM16-13]RGD47204.1 group II intron reverse transcriptase/maturase [Bacteroides sp. AM16-13]
MRDSGNVLNSLAGHSSDLNYKFERLYRLLFNENLYALAYQNIASNEGNCTKGADGQSIDGMSVERIHNIIDKLKDESYQPYPAKRVYIPKKNGKKRPLGIPAFDDKLVHEVVRMILESIYEGHFEKCSHGFRPHRSCHTALASIHEGFDGTRWFIEGDIKGFFDNIDHDVMIGILAERISDQRFLRLIRKFLNAGYMEKWQFYNTYSGAPQGGVVSPILANIYLDKLDKYMQKYISFFNKADKRRVNPEYKRIESRKYKRVKKLKNETDEQKKEVLRQEINKLHHEMQQLPATLDMDENFRRMRYVRYADDFLIGVIGSKEECVKAKEDIKAYLHDTLKLELSDEKTLITNSSDHAKFLGYEVTIRRSDKTRKDSRGITRRSLGYKTVLLLPTEVMRKKLLDYGAMKIVVENGKEKWESKSRPYLRNNDDLEILNRYNSEIRGIYNYYCLANNCNILNSFYFYMKESMYKTLSSKYESTVRKIIRKYTRDKIFYVQYEDNRGAIKERALYHGGFRQQKQARLDFADNLPSYRATQSTSLMARLKAHECEYCGATDNLKMFHVRKLKNLEGKQEWERFMIARKRKTIAVCNNCYRKIHGNKK